MPPRKKGTGVIDTVKKVIYGRKDFPPSVKKKIEANADADVVGLTLHRRVLPKIYHSILSVFSQGETEKLIKETDKDKLFHTSIWLKLSNGHTLLLEKSEVLSATVNPKEAKEEETLDIPAPSKKLTLREMIDKTKETMGDKFFSYSAKDNNCTDFIIELLKSNGLLTKPAHDFLFQNSKKILESVPTLEKIVKLATDIGGRANVLVEGGMLKGYVSPYASDEKKKAIAKKKEEAEAKKEKAKEKKALKAEEKEGLKQYEKDIKGRKEQRIEEEKYKKDMEEKIKKAKDEEDMEKKSEPYKEKEDIHNALMKPKYKKRNENIKLAIKEVNEKKGQGLQKKRKEKMKGGKVPYARPRIDIISDDLVTFPGAERLTERERMIEDLVYEIEQDRQRELERQQEELRRQQQIQEQLEIEREIERERQNAYMREYQRQFQQQYEQERLARERAAQPQNGRRTFARRLDFEESPADRVDRLVQASTPTADSVMTSLADIVRRNNVRPRDNTTVNPDERERQRRRLEENKEREEKKNDEGQGQGLKMKGGLLPKGQLSEEEKRAIDQQQYLRGLLERQPQETADQHRARQIQEIDRLNREIARQQQQEEKKQEEGQGLKKKISKPIKMAKRMVKGSAEAKAFGAKMKALREAKKKGKGLGCGIKGEGFFDDLVSKVRDTASNVVSKARESVGMGVGSMSAENGGRGIAESLLNTKIATQEVKEEQGRGMKKGSAAAKAFGKRMKALREAKMKGRGMDDGSSSDDDDEDSSSDDEDYEDKIIKKTLDKEMKGKGVGNDASACYMLHPAKQSQVTTNPNLGMGLLKHHSHSHHLVHMPIQTHHIPEPPSRLPVSNIHGSGVGPRSRSYVTDPTLLG